MTSGAVAYRHAQRIALAHASRLIVLAQAETGDSVPYATRPLTREEKDAKVRFAVLDAIEERAVKDAESPIEELFETVSAVLLARIGEDLTEGEAREALQDVLLSPPKPVTDGIREAAGAVEGVLDEAYVAASAVALDEADRQGVNVPVAPLRPAGGRFTPAAMGAASRVWTRTAQVVQEDALTVGATADRETVRKALDRAKTAGALDQARQGVHEAQGTGRIDTIEAVDEAAGQRGTFYASELLDGNQCSRCEPVDGRQYASLADSRVDYPNGYYQGCLGGARCRGTIVAIYRPDPNAPRPAPPEEDPAPAPGPVDALGNPIPQGEPEDREAARQAANPHFTDGGMGYRINCSSVVVAVEARRRGYKVTAGPRGKGRTHAESEELWGREFERFSSRKNLDGWMAELPDGARGTMGGRWKGTNSGHIFNWEKTGGTVVYYEGQDPRQDANKYLALLSWGRKTNTMVRVMRVDDLDISEAMKKATDPDD